MKRIREKHALEDTATRPPGRAMERYWRRVELWRGAKEALGQRLHDPVIWAAVDRSIVEQLLREFPELPIRGARRPPKAIRERKAGAPASR